MNTETFWIVTSVSHPHRWAVRGPFDGVRGASETMFVPSGLAATCVEDNNNCFCSLAEARLEAERRNERRPKIGDLVLYRLPTMTEQGKYSNRLVPALLIDLGPRGAPIILLTDPDLPNPRRKVSSRDIITLQRNT